MEKNKERKVWMMTHTDEPIRTLFTAARTCYSSENQKYIAYEEWEKYTSQQANGYPNDALRLLAKIAASGHLSILEHITFTFGIMNVSRSLLTQLTRHRVGFSYSVQSQRYVDFNYDKKNNGFKYVIPESIKNNKGAKAVFRQTMKDIQKNYDTLRRMGIRPEDARYIMPNAAQTNITLTCNLRSFIDLYNKRKIKQAQWEIRELVEEMKSALIKEIPELEILCNEIN